MSAYHEWRAHRQYLRDNWVTVMNEGPKDYYVYRYFDSEGALLYVGCTKNLVDRDAAHRRTSAWRPKARSRSVEGPYAHQAGLYFEQVAIRTEEPEFNSQKNNGFAGPGSVQWYEQEAAEYDALAAADPTFERDAQLHVVEVVGRSLQPAMDMLERERDRADLTP